jgi:hypothetical protein
MENAVKATTASSGPGCRPALEFGLPRGTSFSLSGERSSPFAGFRAARQISKASLRRVFPHEAEETSPAAATDLFRGGLKPVAEAMNGQTPGPGCRPPGKLKHAPRGNLGISLKPPNRGKGGRRPVRAWRRRCADRGPRRDSGCGFRVRRFRCAEGR